MKVPLQNIYTAQETISAGKKLYYENFKMEGDFIKKIALPQSTGSYYFKFPGDEIKKEDYVDSTSKVRTIYSVKESAPKLLLHIFPDGYMLNGLDVAVPKPFLLEPKGGEGINLNLENITSIEIISAELETTKNLEVDTISTSSYSLYEIVTTKYKQVTYDYFAGYDTSKSFKDNFNNGVFSNITKIGTAQFSVNYNKNLLTPARWVDNAKNVFYPLYCILTPGNMGYVGSVWFVFEHYQNKFTITKIEYKTKGTTPAFCSIKF